MGAPVWIGAVPALVLAAVDWTATVKQRICFRYISKPLVIFALLTWLLLSGATAHGAQTVWFAAGLAFSLLGDVFLLLPRNYFLAGLASFLVAHLAYIITFSQTSPPLTAPTLILSLVVVAWASFYYTRIRKGLAKTMGARRLPLAILLYSLVITWMLLSALLTLFRPGWRLLAAVLIAVGGLLFFISDSILAYDRFVRPLRRARLLVIITYHLGQTALTAGMLLHQ